MPERSPSDGEQYADPQPTALTVRQHQLTAMAGCNPLGNAQPQPIPSRGLVTRAFAAHERVGNGRQQRGRDPRPTVVDMDEYPCARSLQRDRNVLGIAQRIHQQILQATLQQQGIHPQAACLAVYWQWFLGAGQVRTLARHQPVQVHLLQILLFPARR